MAETQDVTQVQVEEVQLARKKKWSNINDIVRYYQATEIARFSDSGWTVVVFYNSERTFVARCRESSVSVFVRNFLAITNENLQKLIDALKHVQEKLIEAQAEKLMETLKDKPELMKKLKKLLKQ